MFSNYFWRLIPFLLIGLLFVEKIDATNGTNYCTTNPCRYGGTCASGYGTYLCNCTDNFFGRTCEQCKSCYGDAAPKCFQGHCTSWIQTNATGAVVSINPNCTCEPGWTGPLCDLGLDACASNPCGTVSGIECYNYQSTYLCGCPNGMGGSTCSVYEDKDYCFNSAGLGLCSAGICMNASASGTYACKCMADNGWPYAWGTQCDDLVNSQYCNASMCLYGGCSISWSHNASGILNISPRCSCLAGWTGSRCDTVLDLCVSYRPCQNGGSCDPVWGTYLCTCPAGYTGVNCTDTDLATTAIETTTTSSPTTEIANISDTSTTVLTILTSSVYTGPAPCVGLPCQCSNTSYGGSYYNGQTLCKLRDSAAVCIDGTDGTFNCTCSANFTGTYCDMAANLGVMLGQLYGNLSQEQIAEIRDDLQAHPPKLQDLIPFITGPMATDVREALSWDYTDFFQDAAYERKVIDFEKEFFRWNDVVLGNCFTFNHPNSSTQFLTRDSGRNGGLFVQLRVHEADYPYWVDTAAITVFAHKNGEAIFAESSRTEVRSGQYTKFFIQQTDYHRLNHPYGTCARGINDVASYYYTGLYTIDGCFRSCYQDLLMKSCGCMDPRYPFPDDKPSCDIPQRNCLNTFNTKYGDDPAGLPGCSCPQPCRYSQYDVSWSAAPYLNEIYECSLSSNISACEATFRDTVKIEVNFKSLTRLSYVETPVMSFNIFLGNLGGILGVLCGISIVTFIEFVYLILMLCGILVRK